MMLIHHVREIQLRLLAIVGVLLAGMVVGYIFYEPLFEFIKSPLHGSLHYMSPSGSFMFIVKICVMVGVIVALPVSVYNVIMFVQPALEKRLSRLRVHLTTFVSLLLAGTGAAFGFLLIIPFALNFFYGFRLDGLVAIISADEYLRFVMGIVITFAIIFQLPLLMSLADHIRPLPPRKLLKFEKYVLLGGVVIALVVPFAQDLTLQLLVASPVVVLYNLSIGIVLLQQRIRAQRMRRSSRDVARQQKNAAPLQQPPEPKKQTASMTPVLSRSVASIPTVRSFDAKPVASTVVTKKTPVRATKSIDGTLRRTTGVSAQKVAQPLNASVRPIPQRVISDFRRGSSRSVVSLPPRPMSAPIRRRLVE